MPLFVANVMALRRRVQTTSPYVVYTLRLVFAPRMGWHYWRLLCPLLPLPRSPTHQSSPPFVAANNDNGAAQKIHPPVAVQEKKPNVITLNVDISM